MEERHGMLWLHPDPNGVLDLDNMLEGLGDELGSWGFQELVAMVQTTITKRLNWKLANDTFGETNHFQKLHKHTLGKVTYGGCLSYETFRRNHRFVFPRRMIDELRDRPQEDWRLTDGATTLYFLFPNIQFIIGNGAINIVRLYPHPTDPNESITKINHYFTNGAIAAAAEVDGHDVAEVEEALANAARNTEPKRHQGSLQLHHRTGRLRHGGDNPTGCRNGSVGAYHLWPQRTGPASLSQNIPYRPTNAAVGGGYKLGTAITHRLISSFNFGRAKIRPSLATRGVGPCQQEI